MSIKNWNAGIIRPVAVAPAGPYADGAAPGVWTLDQAAFWKKQGLWPIAGNFLYIEDLFSTYLYTGNSTSGGTQTITNGVDLSTKGGMVWIKGRSAASDNVLFDTARGAGTTASNNQALSSNLTTAEDLAASYDFLSAFNTDGFTVKQGGTTTATRGTNYNNVTYASWTFRKQAKFFDVVTYTGNGTNRTIAHNLGSVPGCIIVKRTDTTADWQVYHRSLANTEYMVLNTTAAKATGTTRWNSTTPTSTVFSLGTDTTVNADNGTYVAYLFAHDAGGFGSSGADNVISCGSYTGTGASVTVNLGYEPQWVLVKKATGSTAGAGWRMYDNMRGMPVGGNDALLSANLADAEVLAVNDIEPTATGFIANSNISSSTDTYIYIAIRRGPMKTPTSGTSVYYAATRNGTGATANVTGAAFSPDTVWPCDRGGNYGALSFDRLRGTGIYLQQTFDGAETTNAATLTKFNMDGVTYGSANVTNYSGTTFVDWMFRRAPGFFDVVCYTGNDTARNLSHNLGVTPELMIVKLRTLGTGNWSVYNSFKGATEVMYLNTTNASFAASGYWNNTAPTSSVFTIGDTGDVNSNNSRYVAYLFATCPGVSKVGSYTGSGTTKQIDCGFTGGARFVLIKRTDSTGDWYVWDSARGIVAGNDPYLLLNSAAAEVTNTDYIDTYSAGFEISSTAPAAINANGGSFIFLAIA